MIKRKKKVCWKCKLPKFLFGKGLCSTCHRKQYKPPKAPKKAKVKKPINQAGKKRKLAYKAARIEYLETHDHCQVALPECIAPYPVTNPVEVLTIHHKKGRIGDLLIDQSNFLACCIKCHRYIEDHPEWAYDNGYSLPRVD